MSDWIPKMLLSQPGSNEVQYHLFTVREGTGVGPSG